MNQLIVKLWVQQLGLLFLASAIVGSFNAIASYSALLGGLIYWLPNAYFTLYAFRFRGAQAATVVLRSIYRGETGKFVLTIIGFALVFLLVKPLSPIILFISYIAMIFSQWMLVSRWP